MAKTPPVEVIEHVRIDQIKIGDRRREKLGPIAELARDIEANKLIHPIVLTDENELVCGGRRLEAFKRLGRETIPARRFGDLSWDEIRTLELSENMRRLDFSTYEQNRQMVNAAEAESGEKLDGIRPVSRGGRGKTGGERKAAAAIGVPRSTLRDAIKHVATAERFPVFQRREWKKSAVLAADEHLGRIPESRQPTIVEMISLPNIPPDSALRMLETFAEKPASEQKEIVRLFRSEEPQDRDLAINRAAKVAPPLPSCLVHGWETRDRLAKEVRLAPEKYKDGFRSVHAAHDALVRAMDADYAEFKRVEMGEPHNG